VRTIDCGRESEAFEAVWAGRWPEGCDDGFREHVADCPSCAEIVEVAVAFDEDRRLTPRSARVPESSVVWWKAQVRARQEAARAAVRPLTAVQGAGLVVGLGVLSALVGATSSWMRAKVSWLADLVPVVAPGAIDIPRVASFVQTGVEVAVVVWLLLAPVAIYLTVLDEGE
jgi:hypothetical protein